MQRHLRPAALFLLAGALLIFTASCGGSDDNQAAGVIHRLLLAAGTEGQAQLESFPGELPDGLPDDVPLYPGADLIVSTRQPVLASDPLAPPAEAGSQALLYLIVLDTADGRDDVFSFYEEALSEDPWQSEGSFSSELLDTLQFSHADDLDLAGAVSVVADSDGDRTSILISLQDSDAEIDAEEVGFEPGASAPIPGAFPSDVPLYADATIIGSAFFREPGSVSVLITFLTTDSQGDVIEFYTSAFEDLGWTVETAETFEFEDHITFTDPAGDLEGDVIADRFDEDRDYTEAILDLRFTSGRESDEGDGDGDGDEPESEGEDG